MTSIDYDNCLVIFLFLKHDFLEKQTNLKEIRRYLCIIQNLYFIYQIRKIDKNIPIIQYAYMKNWSFLNNSQFYESQKVKCIKFLPLQPNFFIDRFLSIYNTELMVESQKYKYLTYIDTDIIFKDKNFYQKLNQIQCDTFALNKCIYKENYYSGSLYKINTKYLHNADLYDMIYKTIYKKYSIGVWNGSDEEFLGYLIKDFNIPISTFIHIDSIATHYTWSQNLDKKIKLFNIIKSDEQFINWCLQFFNRDELLTILNY